MRTVPIPVDSSKLTITCVKAPRPRVLNKDTGEIKTDKINASTYGENNAEAVMLMDRVGWK